MLTPAPDALPPQKGVKRYFFVPKYSFAAIGVDPTSAKQPIFNQFFLWVPNLILFALCFPMTMYASQYLHDLNKVTDAMAPVWQASMGLIKLVLFIWNKQEIVKLVRKIWMWNLEARDEELKLIIEANRRDNMISIFFYSTVFSTGILALSAPFFIASYHSWHGHDFWESLEPPLKGIYFMDPKESYRNYAIAFLWDALGIYAVINGTLSIDTLFSWFIHNISAQFRILNWRFKSVAAALAPANAVGLSCDKKFRKSFARCVRHHQHLIELIKTFDEVFMLTVFVKFAISCIQIAFLAFQFARGGEFASQLFHLSFFLSVSMQLMLYCYGGQRLKDESTSVAIGIYEHFQWEALSVKSRKMLLLPLIRAQKPCDLTGVFFVADLELFLWVYKTAGSFITMMMTLTDNK